MYLSPGSRLELKDGSLTCNYERKAGDGWHEVVFKPEALSEFMRLAEPAVPDERILEYAQEWGLLELCAVGLPRTHDPSSIPASIAPALLLTLRTPCPQGGMGDPERVDWWRYWARQAACLGRILVALRAGRLGAGADWEELRKPGPWAVGDNWERGLQIIGEVMGQVFEAHDRSLRSQRDMAGKALDTWMRLGDLRPEITMPGARTRIALRPRSLFGALGLQLVFAAADIDGFAFCHGCHVPVIPTRQMGPFGQRVFCQDCRRKGRPQQEASLAHYRRQSADPAFRQREAERQRHRRAAKRASPGPDAGPAD